MYMHVALLCEWFRYICYLPPCQRPGTGDIETSPICLFVHLSVCLSIHHILFSHCNLKMHQLVCLLKTGQVCAPCHGGVLYSFWYWWDVVWIVEILKNVPSLRERPLDFQGGGAWVFQSGQNIFSVTFRAKIIFFKLSWARIFFSQAILGQNIFFYTIQTNLEATFQLSRKSVSKLLYWGCLLSVCVCVRPRWL